MSLAILVTISLATAGGLLGVMSLVYARVPAYRRFPEPEPHMRGKRFWTRAAMTSLLSVVLAFGLTFILQPWLFYLGRPVWWRIAVDSVLILVVYDFLYYFMHRYPFHQWGYFMRVHAVHHASHRPIPVHSMYLHPIENLAGIALLLLTIWLLGPIHLYAFGVIFLVYSWLNIFTHMGMDLPLPYIKTLSRKHDAHHKHMRAGNFATLTPLPDMLFGTVER